MSGIDAPDNRPALAWVLSLPKNYLTFAERCLMLTLATDSHDGFSCAPTREDVMRAAGLWGSQYYPAIASLTSANENRPALLAVEKHGRYRRNTYRLLRSPESATTDRSPESATTDRSPEQESRAGVQSRSPEQESRERDAYPSLPLPTLREGERKGEALTAPPPDGGALTRLPVAKVRDVITAVIPEQAQAGIHSDNPDLGDVVTTVLANGWTVDALAVVLADMGKAKKSPTGQAISRLRALADTDPQAVILPTTSTTTTTATADVFADQNQTHVTTFCKWSGASRDALSKALAELIDQGYALELIMRAVNPDITIYDPAMGIDAWRVSWTVNRNPSDPDENANDIYASLETLTDHLTDQERQEWIKATGDPQSFTIHGTLSIHSDADIGAFKRIITGTHPIALAAAARGLQPPPEPTRATGSARPTPTPPAVAEVLADDPRRPGADGFAHFDPPGRITPQPPGHDQAVRQADDLERKRQQRALADMDDPAILEALAALQANGIPTDPQQENPA